MSNYTKTTNFTAKDTALVTDPQKVLRGAEFDTEFNNIETTINSKYDTDSIINLNGGTLTDTVLEGAVLNGSVSGSAVLDDDTFGTASSTTLATSESIKALVDSVGVAGITSTATAEQVVLTDNYLTSKNNVWAPKIHFAPDPSQASEDGDQPDGEIGLDAGNIMFLRAGFANAAQIILDPAYPGSTKFQSDVLVEGDLEVNGNVTSGGVPVSSGGLPDGELEGQFATWDATDSMWKPQTGIFANRNMGNNGDSRDFYVAEGMSTFEVHLASGLQSIQLGTPTAQFEGPKTWFGFHKPQLYAYIDVNDGSGKVTALKLKTDSATFSGTVSDSAGPLMSSRNLIETLSTLRTATQDETTLEGLRDAIGNAIGGLIEKFEAMQESVKQEASSE